VSTLGQDLNPCTFQLEGNRKEPGLTSVSPEPSGGESGRAQVFVDGKTASYRLRHWDLHARRPGDHEWLPLGSRCQSPRARDKRVPHSQRAPLSAISGGAQHGEPTISDRSHLVDAG
jgi:hypothetical protein